MYQLAWTKPVYLQIYTDIYPRYFQIWWIAPYYAGLLIGRLKKVKFRGIFGGKFAEKSTDFAGIFRANLAENQSVKKGRFCGYFPGKLRQRSIGFCADQTSVFNVVLTESSFALSTTIRSRTEPMAKPLTSWLVPSFSLHNQRLVVSELQDVVCTFQWRSFKINLQVYGK